MINRSSVIAIISGFLTLMMISGCSQESATSSSDTVQNEGNTIRVGLLVPFSGECGSYGSSATKAVKLAAQEINDAGGIKGKDVEIIVRDTKTEPISASLTAMELVEDEGVVAILGADASSVSKEILDALKDMNTLIISGASSSRELREDDPSELFFRTVPSEQSEAYTISNYLLTSGDSTARLIYVDDIYGYWLQWFFSVRYGQRGGRIEKIVSFKPGKTSYSAEIESLFSAVGDTGDTATISSDAPVVVLIAYPRCGAQIIRDWRSSGYDAKWILSDGLKSQEFITMVGAQNAEGLEGISAFSGSEAEENLRFIRFKDAYEDYWDEDPRTHRYTEHWYDAMILLGYAMLRADSLDPSVIKDTLNLQAVSAPPGTTVTVGEFSTGKTIILSGGDIDYEGASGSVNMDDIGDVAGKFELWRIQNGSFVHISEVSQ